MAELAFGIQGGGQFPDGLPDPGYFRAIAEQAEELGYDSIWAGEHLSFHNPILDVVVALAAFTASTERIGIGAGIVLLPLRHPSLVAKPFASLDWLSGGRVVLGVGVGGEGGKDFEAAGVPVAERGARADEALRALRELFAGGSGSFSGRFFSFADVRIEPAGSPPIWVGGRSAAAVRRAGRLGDGWMPIWVSPEGFARGWAEVRRQAAEAGRDAEGLAPAVVLPARVGDRETLRDHLARRYAMEVPPHLVERYCVAGSAEECAARVQGYVEAGARHLIFNLCSPPHELLQQCERLFVEVAAGVAA